MYYFTKELGEHYTHVYTPVVLMSLFRTEQTFGHISLSAAELAPFFIVAPLLTVLCSHDSHGNSTIISHS